MVFFYEVSALHSPDEYREAGSGISEHFHVIKLLGNLFKDRVACVATATHVRNRQFVTLV